MNDSIPAGLDIGGRGPHDVALSIGARAIQAEHSTEKAVAQSSTGQSWNGAFPAQRLSAVLVAAGLSQRMGKANKLLLDWEGVPMVRRAAELLCQCPFSEVVVVLGHQQAEVRRALEGLPVRLVVNEQFKSGQPSSVRMGLGALTASNAGTMVCLADQPWLTRSDIEALWMAFESKNSSEIVIPRFNGQRGNPVAMSRAVVVEALKACSAGARRFIDKNDPRVQMWDTPSDHYVRDVDHPEDRCSESAPEAKA